MQQELRSGPDGGQECEGEPVAILDMDEEAAQRAATQMSAVVAPVRVLREEGEVEEQPAYIVRALPRFTGTDARPIRMYRLQRIMTVDPQTRTLRETTVEQTLDVPAFYGAKWTVQRLSPAEAPQDTYVIQVEHMDPELAETILKVGFPMQLKDVPVLLHGVVREAFQARTIISVGVVGVWVAPDGHAMVLPPEGDSVRLSETCPQVQEESVEIHIRGWCYRLTPGDQTAAGEGPQT